MGQPMKTEAEAKKYVVNLKRGERRVSKTLTCDVRDERICISNVCKPIFDNDEILICQSGIHSIFAGDKDLQLSETTKHKNITIAQGKDFHSAQKSFLLEEKVGRDGKFCSDEPEMERLFRNEPGSGPYELVQPPKPGKTGRAPNGSNNYDNKHGQLDHIRDKNNQGCNSFRNASYTSGGFNNAKRNAYYGDGNPNDRNIAKKMDKLLKRMEHLAKKNELYEDAVKKALIGKISMGLKEIAKIVAPI